MSISLFEIVNLQKHIFQGTDNNIIRQSIFVPQSFTKYPVSIRTKLSSLNQYRRFNRCNYLLELNDRSKPRKPSPTTSPSSPSERSGFASSNRKKIIPIGTQAQPISRIPLYTRFLKLFPSSVVPDTPLPLPPLIVSFVILIFLALPRSLPLSAQSDDILERFFDFSYNEFLLASPETSRSLDLVMQL